MEVLAWILAALFAVVAGLLALRGRHDPYRDAVSRLATEFRGGGTLRKSHPDDPAEVAELRRALAGPSGSGTEAARDPEAEALEGLFRYLEGAVLAPLEASLEGSRGDVRLESAVDALRDLGFYAERFSSEESRAASGVPSHGGPGTARPENLPAVVQEVTREYTLESGVPVRFSGPPGTVSVRMMPEPFKDALYLLLANAGHFGEGSTVDVVTESEPNEVRLRIRDRGPGFTEEALDRAFDPFWSSEADALGLGLTHARRVLGAQGVRLQIGNAGEGGGEAVIVFPQAG